MHSRYILFETYLPNFACGIRKYVTTQTQYFSLYYVAMVEVQRTQNSGQSNHFLLLSGLSGLSLDFAWTSSGIQSCPTDSDGLPMDCLLGPLEMAGSDKSPSESVGQAVGV